MKKYTMTEEQLAQAIRAAEHTRRPWQESELWARRIIENLPKDPPSLGPDYLGKIEADKRMCAGNMEYGRMHAQELYAANTLFNIKCAIADYLDGLIEEREKFMHGLSAANSERPIMMAEILLIRKIRTALCGEVEK